MTRYTLTVTRDLPLGHVGNPQILHTVRHLEFLSMMLAVPSAMEMFLKLEVEQDLTLEIVDAGDPPGGDDTIFVAHRYASEDHWEGHAFPYGSKDNDE